MGERNRIADAARRGPADAVAIGAHGDDAGRRPPQRRARRPMTNDDHDSTGVARQYLLTGAFDALIDRIEAHRIDLQPGQRAPRHVHPGGVIGYVVEGEIAFEIDGRPATTLSRGSAFYEPPGAAINRFDNASDSATATFIAFYPLAGDQAIIRPIDRG